MSESNYGSTITKGGTAVGKCKVINYPEISMGKISTTHHASGGVAESIPNGLLTLGDIDLEVILEAGVLSGIYNDIKTKSIEEIVIANAVDTMTFDGYYLSAKPVGADADNPDLIKAAVKLACTGDIVIAPTAP